MAVARFSVLLACGAMLALGACSNSRTVATGGDPAELADEKERADAAEAARDAATAARDAATAARAAEQKRADAAEAARDAATAARAAEQKRADDATAARDAAAAARAAEKQRADDATAARDAATAARDAATAALSELRVSLRNAQAALEAVGSGANARAGAVVALTDVEADLEKVQNGLMDLPAGPATTAVTAAVTAVDDAVAAVKAALAPISASGGVGAISFATMHTTLDRAQAALDDAQARITAALAADGLTDALRLALSQAQVVLSTAQVALVPALRDELAQAERDLAQAERNAAELRGETTLGAPITPERAARNIAPVLSTGGTANVTWTARTDADGNALDNTIKDEAVAYATGKTLISADGNGNDEFKLRGLTARGELRAGFDATGGLEFHGGIEGGSAADLGVTTGNTNWDRTDARVLSSIQLERDGSGFTMKMGGAGTIFYDMERLTAIGPSATFSNQVGNGACANENNAVCDDPTTMDITAAFDNPAKDPDGDASWHFRMVVPTNPATPHTENRPTGADQLPGWLQFKNNKDEHAYRVNPSYTGVVDLGADGAVGGDDDDADTMGYANLASEEYTDPTDGAKYKVLWLSDDIAAPTGATLLEYRRAARIDAGLPLDQLGVYTVKLSNYAGMDDNNEHRYLQYAAYGLFNFLDYSAGSRFARLQAFHFGYDAFNDADGNRPMDFSDVVTTAKFTGKTTGWVLQNPEGHALGHISRLLRVRGDVTLTATLGGGADNGDIEGSMVNFEYLRNGVWSKFPNLVLSHGTQKTLDGVTLESAAIGADGAYAGVAKVMASANKRFGEGRYGGAFYGPRTLGELETAGYWMLPRHIGEDSSPESCHTARTGSSCTTFGSIIGSFGAVSEPPASP